MKFLIKWGLLLIPALALAMPALALPRELNLSDSQQPGSVLIFPYFINAPAVATDPGVALLPRTEIELAVICPPEVTPSTTICFEHQQFKLRAHWVCPGKQDITFKYVCPETSFNLFVSLDGKVAFPADGGSYFTNQPHVPKPQCKNGYLIVWVVNNADQPIKFDGLIGDAVLRGPAVGGTGTAAGASTAVSAYAAIPIQADVNLGVAPTFGNGTVLATEGNELHFDGDPGHYTRVTGTLYGDIKFDNPSPLDPRFPVPAHAIPAPGNAFSETFLILLTLDTNSNHPNNPTFARVVTHNESFAGVSSTNPLFEFYEDGFTEFLCWQRKQLSEIDDNFNQLFMGTRKGTITVGPAEKFEGPFGGDETGAVTLLGVVHTVEGVLADGYQNRSYIFSMYNDSRGVDTEFELLPSGD